MSKVIIKECKNYELSNLIEKINGGVDLLGGWDQFIKPGMNVLLKVNLIGPKSPDSGAITHPEFVRAITRILISKDCNVWIGDSSGGAITGVAPTTKSILISGLDKVALEEGAQIKNFDKEGAIEVKDLDSFGNVMYLAKPMFDADLIINLPKYKTHLMAVYTGAVKNLFGCIPGLKKAYYHKTAPTPEEFGKIIADINASSTIGLNIMDGIIAMQGEGPTAGETYSANKILISIDSVALDTVATKMIGLDIKDLPIYKETLERKLGEFNLSKIEIAGDYNDIPSLQNFKMPRQLKNNGNSKFYILPTVINFLKTKPSIQSKLCKHCNTCVESCPMSAIDKATKTIDYAKCIECMCCHELCMYKAVELQPVNRLVRGIRTLLSSLKRERKVKL
jgi:uncharacterized protein (DUF362 family)/Pyruvate/2-oxoacid:ferredoxin oxidoreductase delta subunit